MDKKLYVESITVTGFGSYKDPCTIELNGGPVAVTGTNGAGKSTIVSKALTWALFGKCAPERFGTSTGSLKGNAIINDDCKSTTVTVRLRDGWNQATHIQRTRTRGKGDKLELIDADASMPLGHEQADIDRLLGCDYDVFVRTVVRGQGDPWNFAEATEGRKREILDAISGADLLTTAYDRARTIAREKQRQEEDARLRREAAAAQLETLGRDVEVTAKKAADWAGAHKLREEAARQELADLEEVHATALISDKEQEEVRARKLALEASPPTLDLDPYTTALAATTAPLQAAHAAHTAVATQAAQMAACEVGKDCPTCGCPVPPDAPVALQKEALATPLAATKTALDAANKLADEAKDAIDKARAWLGSEQAAHHAQVQALEIWPYKAPTLATAIAGALQRLTDVRAAVNIYEPALEQLYRQQAIQGREVAIWLEIEVLAAGEAKMAREWTEALGPKGARASLSEGALYAIESEANKWLSVLSDGTMSVTFEAQTAGKERISTTVVLRGSERSVLSLSGGEKRRLNLAVDLGVAAAFSNGGALSLSLLVLDEDVFSGMDAQGKIAVVNALSGAGVRDVVLIDHDPRLTGALPRTIVVRRGPDGWSQIDA
jgi:DNA repair exonuclease SbcCD ATPase subunit